MRITYEYLHGRSALRIFLCSGEDKCRGRGTLSFHAEGRRVRPARDVSEHPGQSLIKAR